MTWWRKPGQKQRAEMFEFVVILPVNRGLIPMIGDTNTVKRTQKDSSL
jgi:hypothetical protein